MNNQCPNCNLYEYKNEIGEVEMRIDPCKDCMCPKVVHFSIVPMTDEELFDVDPAMAVRWSQIRNKSDR